MRTLSVITQQQHGGQLQKDRRVIKVLAMIKPNTCDTAKKSSNEPEVKSLCQTIRLNLTECKLSNDFIL